MDIVPGGVAAKYLRAQEFLDQIRDIVLAWGEATTYETISEPDSARSELVHCQKYIAKISGPPLPDLSIVLGDCLNNFRATLDHLIWHASVLHSGDPPPDPRRIGFPIFADADVYKGQGLHAVSPQVAATVEELQPYRRADPGSHPLWILSELNNVDKHRSIHFVSHFARTPRLVLESSTPGSWSETMDDGPLEDGTVLARLFTPLSLIDNDVKANVVVEHGPAISATQTTPILHLGSTLDAIGRGVWDAAGKLTRVLANGP